MVDAFRPEPGNRSPGVGSEAEVVQVSSESSGWSPNGHSCDTEISLRVSDCEERFVSQGRAIDPVFAKPLITPRVSVRALSTVWSRAACLREYSTLIDLVKHEYAARMKRCLGLPVRRHWLLHNLCPLAREELAVQPIVAANLGLVLDACKLASVTSALDSGVNRRWSPIVLALRTNWM